jgi:hypothetical protein
LKSLAYAGLFSIEAKWISLWVPMEKKSAAVERHKLSASPSPTTRLRARVAVDLWWKRGEDGWIAEAQNSESTKRRRVTLAGAALVGAAAVGIGWLFVGGSSSNDLAQSLGQAPGIPPPDYAYLDTARVALYLGQLQGGLARSEQLSEQLTEGRNAGLSAGGVSVGGSAGSSASRERVVTPTATARFYQLLDQLDRDGYLHRIDASAPPEMLVREFAQVPEGTFVQLRGCRLRIPSYIQLAQLNFGSSGYVSSSNAYQGLGEGQPLTYEALGVALVRAGRQKFSLPYPPSVQIGEEKIARTMEHLAAIAKRNPRVPFSTCDGSLPRSRAESTCCSPSASARSRPSQRSCPGRSRSSGSSFAPSVPTTNTSTRPRSRHSKPQPAPSTRPQSRRTKAISSAASLPPTPPSSRPAQ